MKLFVWDFHGVMEKGNEWAAIEISNKVLELNGYKEQFSKDDALRLYGLKWFQYFADLLPNLTNEEHLKLQAACYEYAEKNLHILAKYIVANDHVIEVLKRIEAKHDEIVISNSRASDLDWFINNIGAKEFFSISKIFGVNAHESLHTKKEALSHYLKNKEFDGIVIIGDSESDMALKEVAGGITYFYNHPHNKAKSIKADHHITDLRDVLKEL